MDASSARRDLEAWRAEFPVDPYAVDGPLRRLVECSEMDDERRRLFETRMSGFARRVVAEVGPAAARYEHRAHLPELVRYEGFGSRVERVEFDPAYHDAGAVVWDSGLVADSGTPGRAYEQATLLYLLSLEGEAGHACPATCTIGLARALRRRAVPAVRDRFLPALLERDYSRAERGSQFLTEVQGGSDVGANTCEAVAVGDGTWRVSGEKWFCSVANADQFLVTARPVGASEGTAGLGCFVVPRRVEGEPNGFALRRLKEKFGTRGLASGEIDFDGALAWPIGPLEEGFRTAVGIVLNTSRWLTAVGTTGMMRRAYLEAAAYARHRRAFGRRIGAYPAVRATLGSMKSGWLGCLHLWWLLTSLEDRIDAGSATDEETAFHRFLVNTAKYAASVRAAQVVRDGIEILGGNGTIEDFSVLPRLYRDSIVYESWEGTHNVLVAQVLRDLGRFELLDVVADRLDALLARATSPTTAIVGQAAKEARAHAERSIDDPPFGALHFRGVLDRWLLAFQAASLLAAGPGTEEEAAGELLALQGLDPEYRPAADPNHAERIDAVLAGDADA